MTSTWSRGLQVLGAVVMLAAGAAAGCGGGSHDNSFSGPGGDDGGGGSDSGTGSGDDGGDGGSLIGTTPTLASLSITPGQAAITSLNGATAKQTFVVQAHYTNGTTGTLTNGVTWSSDSPMVGAVNGTGLYTANGSLGGMVRVSVLYKGQKAAANLTVKLLLEQNPGNVPPSVQTSLQGATTPDPAVVWAYPYDGTVWPRRLLPPILQWNGGAATDDYYVHIVSPTFELQEFTTSTSAPATPRIALDPTIWSQYTESSSGPTKITVARWDGTKATQITSQTWTIAPASMRGTIYYWSNNLGRVLRIKPGAAMADDFANAPPLNDPSQYPQGGCLMTCHTVSADGSTIVSGGGVFGGSYDLKTNMPIYNFGYGWGTSAQSWQNIQWVASALSPTGKYVAVNAQSDQLAPAAGGPSNLTGMFTTSNGQRVANSGIDAMNLYTPAWSPPGDAIAYVTADDSPWGNTGNGDLHVMSFDETHTPMTGNDQLLVTAASNAAAPNVSWPTFTPDGKWIVFQRGSSSTTWSGHQADLAIVEAKPGSPETPLAALDGTTYPFAAGARDLHYNFEPAFAPVAAGGYFWVVFTSRRTYGNTLTGADTAVKQLWIAAIDQNPKPGVDPSHAAFHLTGQDENNLAMRGYYALPPCAQNGQSCSSGTDCCGGYCAGGADGGAPTCQSMPSGCSQNGDKCSTSSDCCGAAAGVTCINHVCSEPTPQ
jgi:hypothetical protein